MSFDPGVFDPQLFGATELDGLFDPEVFDPALFDTGEESGEPVGLTEVGAAGVKRRSYVEIDGQRLEVSGYAEAERLLRKLKKEEKAQEQDRRKLNIHLKTVDTAPVNGALYKKAVERIQVIETRMDNRLEEIAALYAAIQTALDDQEDEEILLLI